MAAVTALLGGMLGVGSAIAATTTADAAVTDFTCTSDIYSVSGDGAINRVNPTTGTAVPNGRFTIAAGGLVNGLALAEGGGRYIWAYDRTAGQVLRFDATTETTTAFPGVPDTSGVVAGAIDPTSGIYYFAMSGSPWNLYAFDTTTTTMIGQVGTISGLSLNGDMAFDAIGDLYIVSNGSTTAAGTFARVNAPIPTVAGDAALVAEPITETPENLGQYNSVAVVVDGSIAIGSGTTITRVRPENGAVLSRVVTPAAFVDFASCAYPNLVYAQKQLPNGRYLPTDQFRLQITSPNVVNEYIGVTEGTDSGLQDLPAETAGPVLGVDGVTFTVTETGVGTTDLSRYTSTWECVNRTTGDVLASGDGSVGRFTLPVVLSASEIYCTFTNVALLPAMTLDKRVADVIDVNGNGYNDLGDQIVWAFDVVNTGETVLDDVTIDDDMLAAQGIGVTCDPSTLAVGESVTCTADEPYTITQDDVDAGQVVNTATATGTPPGHPPVVTPPDTTQTPVGGYTVEKSSDPASGTDVGVGDTIDYTITVTHQGTADVTAELEDDLSGVLDDATYNGDAVASAGELAVDPDSGRLTWSGDLAEGDVVTITYSVTVRAGGDRMLENVVTSPGCADSCTTDHTVTPPPTTPPTTPPTVLPTAPPTAPPGLAITGGTVAWTIVGGAAAAVLFGAVLLLAARRRRQSTGD